MNSVSQPISLSAPVRIREGKVEYRNPFKDIDNVYDFYHDLWSELRRKFNDVSESFSKKFITDITEHIKSYKYTSQLIPALALLTGVNVSDHDILFNLIKQEIKSITRYPVTFVQSHHDLTVKPVIERMVQSFLTNSEVELKCCENDEDQDEGVMKKLKKSTCTFTRLQLWYESKRNNEDDRTPLIIIIPDVESFYGKVLNEFFSILGVYKSRIPFIIILGIATDLNALHQRVSSPVLQDFDLTIFKAQPSLKFLDYVLEQIFFTTHCQFQLHGKVLEELIDAFTFYNFSVEFFIRGIQFCVINHFWNSNNNILCCPIDRIADIVKSLNQQQFNSLLKLPSVCNYFNNESESKKKLLKAAKRNTRNELVSLLKDLHCRKSRFHVAVQCFYVVMKSIPNSDFKTLRDIYCQAMQKDITKTEKFKQCMVRYKLLSFDTILENINVIEKLLDPHRGDAKIEEYLKKLVEFRSDLQEFGYEDDAEGCSPRKRTQNSSEISTTPKKSPRWGPTNSEPSPSPRKNLFGLSISPLKGNTISQKSPKKVQVDPEDILCSFHESLVEKEEPTMRRKIPSLDISKNVSSSLRESVSGKKKLISPDKLKSPLDSSDLDTTLCIQKSPLESSNASGSSEPVGQLIASIVGKTKTPTLHLNVQNGLCTPPSMTSRSEFQKLLLKKACQTKRPSSKGEQWKLHLVEFLSSTFFKEMLECPANYIFHEIFMYRDLDHVKNNFISVNQRNAIEKALQDPQTVLKCKCCKLKTSGDILDTFPDLCITYKYLQERKLENIDLKSLLTNFAYTVMGSELEEEEVTPEVYNRFRQSLKDLELMGFIKPHKNKPDFVKKVLVRMR